MYATDVSDVSTGPQTELLALQQAPLLIIFSTNDVDLILQYAHTHVPSARYHVVAHRKFLSLWIQLEDAVAVELTLSNQVDGILQVYALHHTPELGSHFVQIVLF